MTSVLEALASLRAAKARAEAAKERAAASREGFYSSPQWRRVRHAALEASDGRCVLCGASAADGAKLHADHIKPVSRFWELRLDPANVQIMCADCNLGKGNRSTRDWREPSADGPKLRLVR